MHDPSGGPRLFSGSQAITPEVFAWGELRLLVRLGERAWAGGRVTVCVWESEEGFPWRPHLARRRGVLDPALGHRSVVFLGLRPGRYAVTAFADRSGKGRLGRTLLGRPAAPVFLTGSMPWCRNMHFDDYAWRIGQSTILDLKPASVEHAFGRSNNGDKNAAPNSRSSQNADTAGTVHRPAAPAHRR